MPTPMMGGAGGMMPNPGSSMGAAAGGGMVPNGNMGMVPSSMGMVPTVSPTMIPNMGMVPSSMGMPGPAAGGGSGGMYPVGGMGGLSSPPLQPVQQPAQQQDALQLPPHEQAQQQPAQQPDLLQQLGGGQQPAGNMVQQPGEAGCVRPAGAKACAERSQQQFPWSPGTWLGVCTNTASTVIILQQLPAVRAPSSCA